MLQGKEGPLNIMQHEPARLRRLQTYGKKISQPPVWPSFWRNSRVKIGIAGSHKVIHHVSMSSWWSRESVKDVWYNSCYFSCNKHPTVHNEVIFWNGSDSITSRVLKLYVVTRHLNVSHQDWGGVIWKFFKFKKREWKKALLELHLYD